MKTPTPSTVLKELTEEAHKSFEVFAQFQAAFETASLLLATDEDLARYPRKPWAQIKKSLGLSARTNPSNHSPK